MSGRLREKGIPITFSAGDETSLLHPTFSQKLYPSRSLKNAFLLLLLI